MKLLRRPKLAAALAVATDILMLVAAVVLDALRERFPAEYTFDFDIYSLGISTRHPYDLFGIAAAVALVFVTVMAAFVIAGGFVSGSGKVAQRISGGIALIVLSAAVVLFSFFIVRGRQPEQVEYIAYTDESICIVIAEERYSGDVGVLKLFDAQLGGGEARLMATTELNTFANGDTERYEFTWVDTQTLAVSFIDGPNKRDIYVVPQR